MGLQRAPPQRANATSGPSVPAVGESSISGNTSSRSLPSPARAFQPRNPGVTRSPPAGSSALPPPAPAPHVDPTPPPPSQTPARTAPRTPSQSALSQPAQIPEPESESMDVDEPEPSIPPIEPVQSTAPTTPPGLTTPIPPITPGPPALTPAPAPAPTIQSHPALFQTPKTPRSRRKTQSEIAEVLDQPVKPLPAVPVPHEILAQEEYGPRWKATIKAVEEATKAGAQRWTAKHVDQIFPLIAARYPDALRNTYLSSSQQFKDRILTHASDYLEHYRTGPALQLIDQVVEEGKVYASSNPSTDSRPDAWRPSLSPAALTAATNLSIYDEAWTRLRSEYIELHQDCQTRYSSILAKQAALKELEEGVADGVLELEQTIKLLDGFPNDEMLTWMEDVAGKMPGARNP